jgi:hypothetical protein
MSENVGGSGNRGREGGGGGGRGCGAAQSAGKSRGKNFTLKEQFALVDAYAKVALDPCVGDQQRAEFFAKRIRDAFLKSDRCPPRSEFDRWSDRDRTTWYGRIAKSCKLQSDSIRSDCTAFHAAVKRVESLNLTGNVDEDGLFKTAVYVFNNHAADREISYKIAAGIEDAPDPGVFKLEHVYKYIIGRPSIKRMLESNIQAVGGVMARSSGGGGAVVVDANDESDIPERSGRPIGQKRAKRLKRLNEECSRGVEVLTNLTDAVSSLATSKLEKSKAKSGMNHTATRASENKEMFQAYKFLVEAAGGSLAEEERAKLDKAMFGAMLAWVTSATGTADSGSSSKDVAVVSVEEGGQHEQEHSAGANNVAALRVPQSSQSPSSTGD